jgi:hypothetical protein
MIGKCTSFLLSLLLAFLMTLSCYRDVAAQTRRPILLEGKKKLYLRLLTRPSATLYKSKSQQSPIIQGNVPPFQLFYAYSIPSRAEASTPNAWYEVGTDDRGTVAGWMKADDVFEWYQTLCLAYSHPQGRSPVLFFEKKEDLLRLTSSQGAQREAAVGQLYSAVDRRGDLPSGFPVISREPSRYVDIQDNFYLLPIFDHSTQRFDNREGRLLKVASVVAQGEDVRQSSDIRENPGYRDEANRDDRNVDPETLRSFAVDVVWVLDTTLSTQPYIDKTLEAVEQASEQLASMDPGAGEKLRFGVWGYRDSLKQTPNLEYLTNNYTPALLPIDRFRGVLQGVRSTEVDAGAEWEEDVFAGMKEAISQTKWRERSARFIILVGDAPGHEAGSPKSFTKFNAERVRSLTNNYNVSVFSLYILDPRAKKERERGQRQFSTLSTNPGVRVPAAFSVPSDSPDFLQQVNQITSGLISTISQTSQGQRVEVLTASAGDVISQTIRAALVEWIGSETHARAPRDVVGWVADKDLIQPAIQSLDIKLLVSKRQLSALSEALRAIIEQAEQAQGPSGDFFTHLQAAVATQARDPHQLSGIQTLAQSGAIPEFLQGLPYSSRVMDMNREKWQNMSADDQSAFLNDLKGKLAYYEHVHATPDLWVRISPSDDPDDFLHPLDFSQLP